MAVENPRLRARGELEELGVSRDSASFLVDDRPSGGWESLVTKDELRAEMADLRSELRDALSKQTWRLATLVVAAQAVVVAAIAAIVNS